LNHTELVERVGAEPASEPAEAVLEIENLRTHFFTAAGIVRAVDSVSYAVRSGETLGVVGESGCGKSVTALSILRLVANSPGRSSTAQSASPIRTFRSDRKRDGGNPRQRHLDDLPEADDVAEPFWSKNPSTLPACPRPGVFPTFKDWVPKEDAVTVARLKAAGAVIFGKTNVPISLADWQSYNDIYGTTNNPWDLGRTPGGSSGGAAACPDA